MKAAAESIGRDPIDLRVVLRLVESAGVPELVAERIDSLAEIGVTDVIIDVDWTADDGPERAASVLLQERRS